MDERAVAPVVGKSLEVAVLVVCLGLVSAALFGSVVPKYRTAAGTEIGDRVLVAAAGQIEVAARAPADVVERRIVVSIPRTIRGTAYVVRAETRNGTPAVVLDHPNPAIGGETALSVPPRVSTVDGEFRSGTSSTVVVSSRVDGTMRVTLQ